MPMFVLVEIAKTGRNKMLNLLSSDEVLLLHLETINIFASKIL